MPDSTPPSDNPYAAPAAPAVPLSFSKTYKIRWARSYLPLKRAHWLLVVMGFLQLLLAGIPAMQFERAVAEAVKLEIAEKEMRRVERKARAQMETTTAAKLKMQLGMRGAMGLTLLIAGLFIFLYPVPMSIIGMLVYLVQFAVAIALVVFAGILPTVTGVLILAALVSAIFSAISFERSYQQHCADEFRKGKARAAGG
jgi:hypothetical protein